MYRTCVPRCVALAIVLIGLGVATASADDWPHWRGPNRDGISAETGWLAQWPEGGPKVLWKADVGIGFSSLAVADGRLYTLGNKSGADYVRCLDAATGAEQWKHSYPCRLGGHKGPRATPCVADGHAYTMSRESDLYCFKAASGDIVWKLNVAKTIGAATPTWGFASSPVIEGSMVIVNVGTAGVALDKATGKVVWTTGKAAAGYSSVQPFTMAGERRLAVFAAKALKILDAKTGKTLWEYPWTTKYDVNAASVIVWDGKAFISSGYGTGAAVVRIGAADPVVWRNREMKNHFNNCVLIGGHLYGFDMNTLKCLDAATGAVKWAKGGFGKGSVMASDGKLILLSDSGTLATAQVSPTAYKELSRAKVISGLCWTVPVLAGGRIYCRSNPGSLVCIDVSGK
ncbi:PQQ-like beta-propeller repeat protein [bacterium]|nr:PQQ-like beta-propeller repeat protein [bacterium]